MKTNFKKSFVAILIVGYFIGFIWRTITLMSYRWNDVSGIYDTFGLFYQCLWDATLWPIGFALYLMTMLFN